MKLGYPQIVTGADLLRGINKLNYVAPLLNGRGATAAGIVNASLVGVPSFYKVMKKYGIQPVIGLTVYLQLSEEQTVLTYVYAKSEIAYRHLLKMSSAIAVTEEKALPLQWLKVYGKECFLVLAMTDSSWKGVRTVEAVSDIANVHSLKDIYVGIARPGGVMHDKEEAIVEVAQSMSISISAVYESRFTLKEHREAFVTAQAIRTNEKVEDYEEENNRHLHAYLPEQNELEAWFSDRLEWLATSVNMLEACQVELTKHDLLMPQFPLEHNLSAKELLEQKCMKGLQAQLNIVNDLYRERLAYELTVIEQMGYTHYFLIVEDFIRYAQSKNILTGPGRGSSAGSLVAYALGITEVDPLKYGLIFERFLNPERITMPDIDIDFEDYRRQEVIDYVAEKYGKGYVAQISTFGTLSARAVARDVARVLGFSGEEIKQIAKILPNRPQLTLEGAYQESPALREWIHSEEARMKWFNIAKILEGLPRNASKHAAGIVLSPQPLVNFVPLTKGDEHLYLTQWPMDDVEEQGLLKMDFLGLRNLTLLNNIRKMIARDQKENLRLDRIPMDDDRTYQLFQTAKMDGVFQFESTGMRETLRLIQPSKFEDIYTATALFRPGPMEYIKSYANRKFNKEPIHYIHPILEPILRETYGIIIYQEQIIQILVQISNYSLGEADIVRRAITSKNRSVIQEEQVKFMKRAVSNGIKAETAVQIYRLIERFADYGFPKSHAVAYSLISYRLAYLKVHYAPYFYAAYLNSITGDNDKINALLHEAMQQEIPILPPSINDSHYQFTVENGGIRIGLKSIQGITKIFYDEMNEKRQSTPWTSLFQFAEAIGNEYFTEKWIAPLIKAGALDEFGESREVLLASISIAANHIRFMGISSAKYALAEKMTTMQKLSYEKEVLGFYLSEHPIAEVKKTIQQKLMAIDKIGQIKKGLPVSILGFVIGIKRIRTRKGEAMAFIEVQDETATISCTLFPKQYAEAEKIIEEKNIVLINGLVEERQGKRQVIAQSIIHIEDIKG